MYPGYPCKRAIKSEFGSFLTIFRAIHFGRSPWYWIQTFYWKFSSIYTLSRALWNISITVIYEPIIGSTQTPFYAKTNIYHNVLLKHWSTWFMKSLKTIKMTSGHHPINNQNQTDSKSLDIFLWCVHGEHFNSFWQSLIIHMSCKSTSLTLQTNLAHQPWIAGWCPLSAHEECRKIQMLDLGPVYREINGDKHFFTVTLICAFFLVHWHKFNLTSKLSTANDFIFMKKEWTSKVDVDPQTLSRIKQSNWVYS